MPDETPHQSVADAITDTAQVAAERPDRDAGKAMNADDEVVADGTAPEGGVSR